MKHGRQLLIPTFGMTGEEDDRRFIADDFTVSNGFIQGTIKLLVVGLSNQETPHTIILAVYKRIYKHRLWIG
jgi:hypothetical protein